MAVKRGNIGQDVQTWPAFESVSAGAQSTTDAYVDLTDSPLDTYGFKQWSYVISCTLQNSYYKILGSNDNSTFVEVVAETALASGADTSQTGTAFFRYYKIQIKENVAGGKISAEGVTK